MLFQKNVNKVENKPSRGFVYVSDVTVLMSVWLTVLCTAWGFVCACKSGGVALWMVRQIACNAVTQHCANLRCSHLSIWQSTLTCNTTQRDGNQIHSTFIQREAYKYCLTVCSRTCESPCPPTLSVTPFSVRKGWLSSVTSYISVWSTIVTKSVHSWLGTYDMFPIHMRQHCSSNKRRPTNYSPEWNEICLLNKILRI